LGWHWGILAASGSAAPGAYELISTQVLSSTVSSVTFSSIPQTYKHLQIRAVAKTNQANDGNVGMTLNGVSSASYFRHTLGGNGSGAFSQAATSANFIFLPLASGTNVANMFGVSVIDILDYVSTSKNKTVRALSGRSGDANQIQLTSGSIASTSALTSLGFAPTSGSFVANSRFSLYGIKGD